MSIISLSIPWDPGVVEEHVALNLTAPPELGSDIWTDEVWTGKAEPVCYRTKCVRYQRTSESIELQLRYAAFENTSAPGARWGLSTIKIDLRDNEATATWDDDKLPSVWNGKVTCSMANALQRPANVYETIWRIARPEQKLIRERLLSMPGACCAISGEATPAVLDVAHILAVGEHFGAYTRQNCMLLRTDLHRLFDSGLISVNQDGVVEVNIPGESRYRDEFSQARLRDFDRVSDALAERRALLRENGPGPSESRAED